MTQILEHLFSIPDFQQSFKAMSFQSRNHAGKLLIHIGPTFLWQNYCANIYLIHVKFGTVNDIFMVNVSIVLDFCFLYFGLKMTSQNGVKILN